MKIILARAMANYSDTYIYLQQLLQDEAKFERYLKMICEIYCQNHEIIEHEGKFGILDHHGNVLVSPRYDFLRTCYVYVDDLVTIPIIAQKDGKMGLIALMARTLSLHHSGTTTSRCATNRPISRPA